MFYVYLIVPSRILPESSCGCYIFVQYASQATTTMSARAKLFQPVQVGDLRLSNCIMLTLTRFRASHAHVPGSLAAEHYAQQASTKFEWRVHWTEVHQGIPNVCWYWTDPTPTHSYTPASLIKIWDLHFLDQLLWIPSLCLLPLWKLGYGEHWRWGHDTCVWHYQGKW